MSFILTLIACVIISVIYFAYYFYIHTIEKKLDEDILFLLNEVDFRIRPLKYILPTDYEELIVCIQDVKINKKYKATLIKKLKIVTEKIKDEFPFRYEVLCDLINELEKE